jgi:hypothetical protein
MLLLLLLPSLMLLRLFVQPGERLLVTHRYYLVCGKGTILYAVSTVFDLLVESEPGSQHLHGTNCHRKSLWLLSCPSCMRHVGV